MAAEHAQRVLVLAPVGRDAELLTQLLEEAEVTARPCADGAELATLLCEGAGAVVLTHEALTGSTLEVLDRFLEGQEAWSDLPFIVLVSGGRRRGDTLVVQARARTMTVLERPTRRATLVTTVRSALRARARQYEIRDLVGELEASKERLEARVRERTEQLTASNARLSEEIRERTRAADLLEIARSESEAERQRVTTILESVSDAFVALDTRFRFTYANARATALLAPLVDGSAELLGMTLWDALPGTHDGTFGEALRRVAATRTPAHFEEHVAVLATWFQVHVYPSDDGLAIYLQDITTRKRTEAELREAIEAVMSDTAWFSRSLLEKLAHVRARNQGTSPRPGVEVAQLTRRERQVLERLADGWDNGQIAADLSLAEQTIRNYVTNIYEKLGVHSRAEAVVWARDRGLSGS
jgi:DNA-binding NarL/FixJ family response regulator/CheY-like chemotaxis protein